MLAEIQQALSKLKTHWQNVGTSTKHGITPITPENKFADSATISMTHLANLNSGRATIAELVHINERML